MLRPYLTQYDHDVSPHHHCDTDHTGGRHRAACRSCRVAVHDPQRRARAGRDAYAAARRDWACACRRHHRGSGPTDRNGNSLMGIRPNSYAQLAWGLAERGIASLRYDKRVLPATKGSVDISRLTLEDFAADARAAAESLARDPRFSRTMLLGHSEGSALALIAARSGPPVSGVISVSGLGRPLGVVIREQLTRQFDSATLVRYDTAMAQYLRGEQPKDVPPPLAPLFVPINLSFMKSLSSFDPPAAIRAVRQPVLIVQGGRDLQVTVADAERLHGAKPDAQLVVVPLANHVLKQATDTTLTGQMPTYQNPTVPIMPDVASNRGLDSQNQVGRGR